MSLPNFLIVGAQKAGTTWLVHNLQEHPDIFMPKQEIHFFDRQNNFSKGVYWYKSHFAQATNQKAVGEKTPEYLWVRPDCPDIHRVIHSYLPEAKLIIVLRNPIERAIAQINHLIRSGHLPPFVNIDNLLFDSQLGMSIIDRGNYYRQIKSYYEVFKPSQILILINEEDILINPKQSLEKVCKFLEVDSSYNFSSKLKKIHKHSVSKVGLIFSYYFPLTRSVISKIDPWLPNEKAKFYPSKSGLCKLHEIYKEENEKLFELLDHRISSW